MGRLRQLNPNNYGSSSAIHADIENLIRYIISGERGGKSYGEMFQDLFDENGEVALGVEFKFDADGLSMRQGGGEWEALAGVDDLRGSPGRDVGNVVLPIVTGMVNVEATAGQTIFPYVHGPTDTLFVHLNGILLAKTLDYSSDPAAGTITLTNGATGTDVLSVYKVRGDAGVITSRTDTTVTAASQAVFGVNYPSSAYQEQVYLNGVLLAAGADYILTPGTSSITLLEAAALDDVLSVVFLSSSGSTEIPGFLLEGIYTDMATGLIPFSKVYVPSGAIDPSKVDGLPAALASSAKMTIGSATPSDPESGDFWLDTSASPAVLKIYDASQFVSVQPSNTLPTVRTSDAGYAIFINSTGTGFSYKPIDLSALIPNSQKGVAAGVATLDADGRLDPSQQPEVRTRDVINVTLNGVVANGTFTMRRLFGERFRIIGLSVKTKTGTCTVQLAVSGVAVGSTYSAASAANDQNFTTVIEVDALVASKTLDVIITAASSCEDVYVTAVIERLI